MYKKLLLLGIVIILGIGAFLLIQFQSHSQISSSNEHIPLTATISNLISKSWYIRIFDTPRERELGLSTFDSLPINQGALFLFDEPGNYPFWMKDMHFPLDIIWLNEVEPDVFEIVFIAENILPESYPNLIDPAISATAVLELNAFQAKQYDITVGGLKLFLTHHIRSRKPVVH